MKSIEVVAAIIQKGDKIFATQRGYGDFKDWWEFPGGKMEPGETPEEALVREIREDMIQLLNDTYRFFKIEPADIPLYSQNGLVGHLPFTHYFRLILEGKAYKEDKNSKELILAFEKQGPFGDADYKTVREEIENYIQGGSIDKPVELKP